MMMMHHHRGSKKMGIYNFLSFLVEEDYTQQQCRRNLRLYPLNWRRREKRFGFPPRLVAYREKEKRPNALTSFLFFSRGRKKFKQFVLPRH
jgi:hypothetical protein